MKSWKELNAKRKILSVFLLMFITTMFSLAIINHEDWFTPRMEIVYPDQCIEKYKGHELLTPICENGRMLNKTFYEKRYPQWQYNLTIPNLTG